MIYSIFLGAGSLVFGLLQIFAGYVDLNLYWLWNNPHQLAVLEDRRRRHRVRKEIRYYVIKDESSIGAE